MRERERQWATPVLATLLQLTLTAGPVRPVLVRYQGTPPTPQNPDCEERRENTGRHQIYRGLLPANRPFQPPAEKNYFWSNAWYFDIRSNRFQTSTSPLSTSTWLPHRARLSLDESADITGSDWPRVSCNRVQHWSWLTTACDVTPPGPGYATTIVVTRLIMLPNLRRNESKSRMFGLVFSIR